MATVDVQVSSNAGDIAHRLLPTDVLTAFHILGNIPASWTGVSLFHNFTTVNVPNAATIDTAFMTLKNESTETGNTVRAVLEAEDLDSASDITTNPQWHANARTTAKVTQEIVGNGVAEADFQFDEMKTVIQELVDRGGWVANNNMGLFIDDTGLNSDVGANRRYYDHEASPSKSAKLHIEFTVGPPAPLPATRGHTSVHRRQAWFRG